MGVDITSFVEVRKEGKWVKVDAFSPFSSGRNRRNFSFLSGFHFYDDEEGVVKLLTESPRGVPTDSEYLNSISPYAYDVNPMSGEPIPENERETNRIDLLNNSNYFAHSWVFLKELTDFNYDQPYCEGETDTYRNYLSAFYFTELASLLPLGSPEDVRIIFYFDN